MVTWTKTEPALSTEVSAGLEYIRDNWTVLETAWDVDHTALTGDGSSSGTHDKVTMPETTTPSNVANTGILYTKDVSSATELHYEDDSANEVQLTDGGQLFLKLVERTAPANAANTGFVYTKDVSGATELYYEDDSGNEVQVTHSGRLANSPDAFCYFDGTAATPISATNGYNVTNVTKSATGTYVVNFTTALADANYSAFVQCINTSALIYWYGISSVTKAAGSFSFKTTRYSLYSAGGSNYYVNASVADVADINVVIFRNP